MPLHEIVVGEVKGDRCLEILKLLAECIGEARQTAYVKARCTVQAFDMASRGQSQIRESGDALLFRNDDFGRAVLPLWVNRIIVNVSLDNLRKVHIRTEGIFDSSDILAECIARNLNAVTHARFDIKNESIRCFRCALSAFERRDYFCFGINRAERPNVSPRQIIVGAKVPLFLADESPYLIELQIAAR